jgi:hypothetical protein
MEMGLVTDVRTSNIQTQHQTLMTAIQRQNQEHEHEHEQRQTQHQTLMTAIQRQNQIYEQEQAERQRQILGPNPTFLEYFNYTRQLWSGDDISYPERFRMYQEYLNE